VRDIIELTPKEAINTIPPNCLKQRCRVTNVNLSLTQEEVSVLISAIEMAQGLCVDAVKDLRKNADCSDDFEQADACENMNNVLEVLHEKLWNQ
jgi:hypothetical protein